MHDFAENYTQEELREILDICPGYCYRVLKLNKIAVNTFNASTPVEKTKLLVKFMEICEYDDRKTD